MTPPPPLKSQISDLKSQTGGGVSVLTPKPGAEEPRKNDSLSQPGIEPTLFEMSRAGHRGTLLPKTAVSGKVDPIPDDLLRKEPACLPELAESEVVRHFTRLSKLNFSVDTGMYPLGSCTMKYNPKICESIASRRGLAGLHPYWPESRVQGALRLMFDLEKYLQEVSGMDQVTLQPSAGAHGEFLGLKLIARYFEKKGEKRTKVLLPDTAHGTNPASASMSGFEAQEFKSNGGMIDPKVLRKVVDDKVAAIMITNPNTLGLFEKEILKVAEIVHEKGGFVYGDGANLNAILGKARPGDLGFDVIQFNLHKTFSTPHGGGGPGAGPVGVKNKLSPYLPVPRIQLKEGRYSLNFGLPDSVGRVRSFYGNFMILVRAYVYILSNGSEGLKEISERAVLNANYLKQRMKDRYHVPYEDTCMHEFIASDRFQKQAQVSTLDIAKRIIDFGFHPPTIYFPLVVPGAMMIEPTESESKATLDRFAHSMNLIANEIQEDPDRVRAAPHTTPCGRVNEVLANRYPVLSWDL
ncbi:MAG: aminomethyl-transferring glycine dehydrogenase subunit GcvPB [Nitrospirae bacterium]|nr:aminomethyl-transferring glycine dehydrogenase subunit GcvPB [Nitrospirota bacterium]